MRLILFFDLPNVTDSQKTEYRHFVTLIKKEGFFMLQESVYTKLALTPYVAASTQTVIEHHLPKDGMISVLTVTEKQFEDMKTLLGDKTSEVLDTDERLIEL
jgi:CRISPR-associated protein Cas2